MESSSHEPGEGRRFLPPRVEILRLDFSRRGKPAREQARDDRDGEIARVVKRLLAIVREHRASARRVGSPLGRDALRTILQALRIESFGGDPRPLLHHRDPVAAYLRESLFQELLEEPSNVLFTTRLDDETVRYEAMEAAFWRECLAELEERVAGNFDRR
jgi:hypothetical protein